MDETNPTYLKAQNISADDQLYYNGDRWTVTMVTDKEVWLTNNRNGLHWTMSVVDFNSTGFDRYDGQPDIFQMAKDEGYEKA